ncbi:MAG: nitrite/sulfite reductase [Leeuwenhoekiella sp.]
MQSFRTEIENPVVERDIIDLEKKIRLFKEGKIDEERFRSLRLARGVYGQRQEGVQMIRIKLPYGKVKGEQLVRIAAVADEYSTGKLHITTRQDIQIHYVSLDRAPELWAELEKDDVTLREACGNTVRNVTASETAGIDADEVFDVSPYAHAVFQFFLRNPICQEMGRKFKISFSSTDEDTALAFMHDLGFIPKIKDGEKGFQVMLGGGLGSQPRQADLLYEFLPVNKLIPTVEGVLRIFDRHGERSRRLKARMKYLIKDIGKDAFMAMVEEEQKAFSYHTYEIDTTDFEKPVVFSDAVIPQVEITNQTAYDAWKRTNVFEQKQKGLYAIGLKIKLGDFSTDKARFLAGLIKKYASNELRLSLRQNILLRDIRKEALPFFYTELQKQGFANPGYNTTADITACPGTDTCNLGIASSTGIADVLEGVLHEEYPEYINNKELTIKISGCMNACGQHNMSHIGFQGMSIRTPEKLVAPALQVLLGGGVLGNGQGRFSDKVIKIPSKRGPQALRTILDDYKQNGNATAFLDYYDAQGQKYFYEILKPLSSTDDLVESDFIDWGNDEKYVQEVGVGECAGVIIDLVQTLLLEAKDKLGMSIEAFEEKKWADSIYHTYAGLVNGAKALLLAEDVKTNTQANIITEFDNAFDENSEVVSGKTFSELVYQIKENEPTAVFAEAYLAEANAFFDRVDTYRKNQLAHAN